jgi:hypothetical protein
MSTSFIVIVNWIKLNADKLSDEIKDMGTFLGHMMFISICFSIISSFISFIYGILFYFGFSNTIIFVKIVCVLLMSGLLPKYKEQLNEKLTKSNIGRKILEFINYYYNTYVVSKKIYEKIIEFVKFIIKKYVWVFCKIIFHKFIKINNELSNNSQSKIVKSKLDEKYDNAKKYIIDQVIQPMVMKQFQHVLDSDPFTNINFGKPNSEISPKQYKNTIHTKSINMSSLTNKKTIDSDNIDDLDEELDLSNVPEVSKEQIEKAEKIDKTQTIQDNRAALKKKMAEKKAMRTSGSKNQKVMNNISNLMNMPEMNDLMNMPGMNEMMKNMLKNNNLEKIVKQTPKNGSDAPSINNDLMNQLMNQLNKKKLN